MIRAAVPHVVSRPSWHRGYRRHSLRLGSFLVVVVALVGEFLVLTSSGQRPARLIPPIQLTDSPRVAPGAASRDLNRPWLALDGDTFPPSQGMISDLPPSVTPSSPVPATVPTSSAVRASGSQLRSAQPSPSVTSLPPRSVTPPAPSVKAGEAEQAGPTAQQWENLRRCESGDDYSINTGNGYYGAYQFNLSTWASNGGTGRPDLATPAEQDRIASLLYSRRGAQPWPVCGRYLR